MAVLIQCYNKGCQQKFDPTLNKEDSCRFHPGQPVFHDALKGWSCCKKRSTDFTEFLNMPGCATGLHNNDKPPEPEKPEKEDVPDVIPEPVRKPVQKMERPSVDLPMTSLSVTVGATLKQALDKQMKQMELKDKETDGSVVAVGTSCCNSACNAVYESESSLKTECCHHPGVPVFHEGMKFWSCCMRKTTDFDSFLGQAGCEVGKHVWIKEKKVACRYDWHQTAGFVTVSVFAKCAIPEKCEFKANPVCLNFNVHFDGGSAQFDKFFELCGVIDPDKSNVKLLGTKVEINLKKAEPGSWSKLEIVKPAASLNNSGSDATPGNTKQQKDLDSSDESPDELE